MPLQSHFGGLIRDAMVGAFLYAAVSGLIWFGRGRPSGIEQDLLTAVKRKIFRARH